MLPMKLSTYLYRAFLYLIIFCLAAIPYFYCTVDPDMALEKWLKEFQPTTLSSALQRK